MSEKDKPTARILAFPGVTVKQDEGRVVVDANTNPIRNLRQQIAFKEGASGGVSVNMGEAELSSRVVGKLITPLISGLHDKYPLYDVDDRTKNLLIFPLTLQTEPKFTRFTSESQTEKLGIYFKEGIIAIEYSNLPDEANLDDVRRRRLFFTVGGKPEIYFEDVMYNGNAEEIASKYYYNSMGAASGGRELITDMPRRETINTEISHGDATNIPVQIIKNTQEE